MKVYYNLDPSVFCRDSLKTTKDAGIEVGYIIYTLMIKKKCTEIYKLINSHVKIL